MEKSEFRVLIKHYLLRKKTITETKERLDKYYENSAPSILMVKKWFTEFRCGRTSTSDAERSGRPKEVITPKIVDKIHGMILNDRRMKVREVAEAVGISIERVRHILHECLDMKKLSARWVPRLLTLDHKRNRVHTCVVAMAKIHNLDCELLPHPECSPDVAPSNYFLFPNMKKWLGSKRFGSNEEVITEANAYFEGLEKTYY
ncbi:uncharacterized protein LOC117183121 [Belonocnema kinseyi]|uniref:uncharacterized protein LOC117183121 n=1 Tax=Belonocnema kinseyi TaxID=2817044 RepID=UPI00143DFF45|nr:uncharacterized protein LOC117183121 [Belonocnema kinseyi]